MALEKEVQMYRTHLLFVIDQNTIDAGAYAVKYEFEKEIKSANLLEEVKISETGSVNLIGKGVIILVFPDSVLYTNVSVNDVKEIVNEHLLKGRPVKRLVLSESFDIPNITITPTRETLKKQNRIVLERAGVINPESIEEYIATMGYEALGKVVTNMKPAEVVDEVKKSGLRGRGGAGFPTGLKWSFTAPLSGEKYVVCNADEGEPGTFKDRLILEGDPHKLIEGMAICGYAVGAIKGYVYIRGEYTLSIQRLAKAIRDAKEYGFLGNNIFGSNFSFDIEIRKGAGAYVCGEETALIESMEGKRGHPRAKPPFPGQVGFRNKPTVVNNVETLANVPNILLNGADWYKSFGTKNAPGTKVYTILGKVNHPGLIEVPMGITLRQIINEYAGGMAPGSVFKAAQIGGSAGALISEKMLDTPLDYDSLGEYAAVLGSGAILILDQKAEIPDFLRSVMKFFAHESCGKCSPCRIGTKILLDRSIDLYKRKLSEKDWEDSIKIAKTMEKASFCALGQSLILPISSANKYFREELKDYFA
ncbi:MAG: NADH-quinone oxidoreductase subunit NuoF [Spirochaetales bacterium]|nr:NADH-quinone oxidoreductase subunit NuoF [Spirochaetales bacterium]